MGIRVRETIFCILLLIGYPSFGQNFRCQYLFSYSPDSTNIKKRVVESTILLLDRSGFSSFAAANYYKKDSLRELVRTGKMNEMDLVAKPEFKLPLILGRMVCKSNFGDKLYVHETIAIRKYKYTLNRVNWSITSEEDSIAGYLCTKALGRYAGRDYIAWFTIEIPISDGPYIFSGLPGLIVKIGDTRENVMFSLENISPFNGSVPQSPVYYKQQPIEITSNEAFLLKEEARNDPMAALSKSAGHSLEDATFQRSGSDRKESFKDLIENRPKKMYNPIELEVP